MQAIKIIIYFIAVLLAITSFSKANDEMQITIKVEGNCNMCKKRIEEALKIPEVKYASWNKRSKNLKIIYENKISVDSLEKRIASVGHDTQNFKAPDDVYNTLPECCLYRTNKHTH